MRVFFNNLVWAEKKYQAIKSETDPDISLMYGEVELAGMKLFPGKNLF